MSVDDLRLMRHVRPERSDTDCIETPEFDPGRLLAWKQGHEDIEVVTHLGRCAACRALMADLEPASAAQVDRIVAALHPRPRRRWLLPAVAAAAALAAGLWLSLRPLELPSFRPNEPLGGVQEKRDGVAPSRRFVATSRLEWTIPPATAVDGPFLARGFRQLGDRWQPLPEGTVQIGPGGTVVLAGLAGTLLGDQPGPVRLRVVVAGDEADLAARLAGPTGDHVFDLDVERLPEDSP